MRISDWSSDVCSSDLPASRIEKAAAPFDRPSARVLRESRGGVGGDGERARSDRDMGAGDADKIDHQRHGEDRAAAAYEAEREADDAARQTAKQILERIERHPPEPIGRGAASHSRPRSMPCQ